MLALPRGISPRVAVISAALCLVRTPTFAQEMPQNKGQGKVLTNHLLERCNVQDQLEIAHALQPGLGVDPDLAEAARWFHRAADQGNPEAQCQLGFLYRMGSGVPRDDREALKWFQRAALENYAPAQFDLSLLLLQGSGAPRVPPFAAPSNPATKPPSLRPMKRTGRTKG